MNKSTLWESVRGYALATTDVTRAYAILANVIFPPVDHQLSIVPTIIPARDYNDCNCHRSQF